MDRQVQVLLAVVGLSLAAISSAQPVQVGNLPASPTVLLPQQVVDLDAGAPVSGVLTSATFAFSPFSTLPCPAAVKIQILRSGVQFNSLHLVTERGPFDVTQTTQTVSFSPAALQAGDSVGVVSLTTCGTFLGAAPSSHRLWAGGPNTLFSAGSFVQGATLALAAFGTQTPFNGISGVIPVVYTGDGAANSHFRTELQLHNPTAIPISGELIAPTTSIRVFDGIAGPYSLGPFETTSGQILSSLNSVDIVPTVGLGPVAVVHIFNDAGSEGTVGFTEPDVHPSATLAVGERAVLLGPADPTNFRFNIGFRSLGFATATQMTVTARSSDGTPLKSVWLGWDIFIRSQLRAFSEWTLNQTCRSRLKSWRAQ